MHSLIGVNNLFPVQILIKIGVNKYIFSVQILVIIGVGGDQKSVGEQQYLALALALEIHGTENSDDMRKRAYADSFLGKNVNYIKPKMIQ